MSGSQPRAGRPAFPHPQIALDERQAEAVAAPPGPLLILAGPGAGKTLTLTHRAAHLIATGQARPEHVLAITFTNRAAEELAARLRQLVGLRQAELITVGTFHAVCHRMVRPYAEQVGRSQRFSIYDAADSRRLAAEAAREAGLQDLRPEEAARTIAVAKARLWTPARLAGERDEVLAELALLWQRYEKLLAESDALDFEDLIRSAVALLEQDELRERLRARHRTILVDEFQDTSAAQHRWVLLLAGERPNLTAVADDDQAIYGFRAAEVAHVLSFERDFPGARVASLRANFRSTTEIVSASSRLVAHNAERREKQLVSAVGQGPPVRVEALDDEREEALAAARWCRSLIGHGLPAGELAILYRTRALCYPLEDILTASGVPYRVLGGQGIFERSEVRDVLALVTLVVNPRDRAAFARAICTRRGIGPVTVARLAGYATDHALDLVGAARLASEVDGLKGDQVRACERFGEALCLIAGQSEAVGVGGTVTACAIASGLPGRLPSRGDTEAAERLERLRQLVRAARAYERTAEKPSLPEFLGQVALSAAEEEQGGRRRVTLGTVHAAKGLEWRRVRVIGLEEGLLPSHHAVAAGRVEEERRLAYVAMTRAREECVLSFARVRRGEPRTVSRFVGEAGLALPFPARPPADDCGRAAA